MPCKTLCGPVLSVQQSREFYLIEGVCVTGQFGSHELQPAVGPYQFKEIFDPSFTLHLTFILNLDRGEQCYLLSSLKTPTSITGIYMY